MIGLSILAAALMPAPEFPRAMQGVWDRASQCHDADGSDARLLIRAKQAVFGETFFAPTRVLSSDPAQWSAVGSYQDVDGETTKGRLTLHLVQGGRRLTYTNYDGRLVRLTKCGKR